MSIKDIYIQSVDNDRSTDDVISWLHSLDNNCNIILFLHRYKIENINFNSTYKNNIVQLNEYILNNYSKFWYRRGVFTYQAESVKLLNLEFDKENVDPILSCLNDGITKSQINKFNDNLVEKIHVLKHCKKLKINIPDFLITKEKKRVIEFIDIHKSVIAKPISNPSYGINYLGHNVSFNNLTVLINSDNIEKTASHFLPSFFQQYIEKKYEIRSFYFKGTFRSMAIFSQQNEKTKIDFRNYDYERPNRCVPYKLPQFLEKKLHKLMKKLEINCGSFDIILTPEDEYFFLEVNPIGQFQWLSQNCNYFIERMIAKDLLK